MNISAYEADPELPLALAHHERPSLDHPVLIPKLQLSKIVQNGPIKFHQLLQPPKTNPALPDRNGHPPAPADHVRPHLRADDAGPDREAVVEGVVESGVGNHYMKKMDRGQGRLGRKGGKGAGLAEGLLKRARSEGRALELGISSYMSQLDRLCQQTSHCMQERVRTGAQRIRVEQLASRGGGP